MEKEVLTTFRTTAKFLRSELSLMPLSRWNESVLRYYFCRFLATTHPGVQQLVECDKIDLVLRHPPCTAFVEFKFYRHPLRYDPYDGAFRGYKGGPGPKNLAEFEACIDQLHSRRVVRGLSKYVVLVYADPLDGSRPKLRFSRQYDNFRHPDCTVTVRLVDHIGPVEVDNAALQAQLYEVR